MRPATLPGLDNLPWPALLVDSGGNICRASPAARRLFGAVLQTGAPKLSALWAPDNQYTVLDYLRQWEASPSLVARLQFQSKDGNALPVPASVLGFDQNGLTYYLFQLAPETLGQSISPEEDPALAHKQKLECALQLARTVALDFNNALTSILGHTSLVLSQMELTHPWRGSLLEVEKSAAKAAEIANDLGTFSRQDKEVRSQAAGNLNLLVKRTVEFFQQNTVSQALEWKLQLERNLFAARFDEAKMQQALIKILENSLQAIRGQGRISLQTRNLELAEATQDRDVHLPPGAHICVEVSDNGCGIEPEVRPRIFEPFYTTKQNHRGLGLAWVYGIITNHGGGVAVSSQVGTGTSVRIYVPAEKRLVQDQAGLADDLSGTQTVLMVDDEDLLLTMGQTILSAYGYRVLTADSGQKALEILATPGAAVDLVITDLVMPAMTGRELIENIRRLSPSMRILCTSGYVWPASQQDETAYLQKPFTSRELLVRVKQSLAG